jgi:hypothetical protein
VLFTSKAVTACLEAEATLQRSCKVTVFLGIFEKLNKRDHSIPPVVLVNVPVMFLNTTNTVYLSANSVVPILARHQPITIRCLSHGVLTSMLPSRL